MQVTPLGRELKRLRADHALTIRQLADRLNKSVGYLGKIEAQGEIPTAELICSIAAIFGESPERLLKLAKDSVLAQTARDIDLRYSQALGRRKYAGTTADGVAEHNPSEERRMATTVSLINMKGGVGKTTLAAQLAHAADSDDLRVLAIDLDPQSNLSQVLMNPRAYVAHLQANKPTVVQILDDYVPASGSSRSPKLIDVNDLILKNVGVWSNSTLDLIPSRLELSRSLKNPTGKERRLAKAIAQVEENYDLILIDCAPTESILTDVAYFASRHVIVPIKPEFMATIGLPLLARSLQEFQLENNDHEIEIAGLVFNHSSSYSNGPEGQRSIRDVATFAADEGWYVCENQMRYSASYAKSAREGTPIGRTSYARNDVVADFRKLKDEVFNIVGLTKVAP